MMQVKDEPCDVTAEQGVVLIESDGAVIALTPTAAHLTAEMLHQHGQVANGHNDRRHYPDRG